MEPKFLKARKLLALATSATEPGEKAAAAAALARHLEAHGISIQHLLENTKRVFSITAHAAGINGKSPDLGIAQLCAQVARYVCGDSNLVFCCCITSVEISKAGKMQKAYEISTEMCEGQADDWREAFAHYASIYVGALKSLRDEKKQAARLVAKLKTAERELSGSMANSYGLFAPNSPVAQGLPTDEELEIMILASQNIAGPKWEKKTQPLLLAN